MKINAIQIDHEDNEFIDFHIVLNLYGHSYGVIVQGNIGEYGVIDCFTFNKDLIVKNGEEVNLSKEEICILEEKSMKHLQSLFSIS